MARSATIYRATVELSLIDRDRYTEKTVTVARHPSETVERMAMRLLAFGLRYEDALEFGRGVSVTDEPDLWSRRGDGSIDQWVEVGQPDGKRLIKATRQAQQVTLFAFGEGIERWRTAQIDSLKPPGNLGIARIDDGFVAALSSSVDRQIRWSLTLSEGVVYWSCEGQSLDTAPAIWLGDPLR